MRRHASAAALAWFFAGAALAQPQLAEAGRQKAQMCAACHGALGLANAPDAPHLAGQSAIYVAAQLRAYRSGARRHEQMNVIARALSDEDIAALAAWYASLRIDVQAPS